MQNLELVNVRSVFSGFANSELHDHRAGKFPCKNIFMVCCKSRKYFTTDISTFRTHGFTAQLASYFTRDDLFFDIYPQVTCGKCVTTFLVSDKLFIFTATAHTYSIPWFSFARKYFAHSCMRPQTQHIFLACVVLFVITKPGNVESI